MAKYLHYFETLSQFEEEYNETEPLVISFICSAGTFTYDRHEDEYGEYVWKNGNKELMTGRRILKVGDSAYDPENDAYVEITAIGETESLKYYEPWVSYTPHEKQIMIEGGTLYSKEPGYSPQFVGSKLKITPMKRVVARTTTCK